MLQPQAFSLLQQFCKETSISAGRASKLGSRVPQKEYQVLKSMNMNTQKEDSMLFLGFKLLTEPSQVETSSAMPKHMEQLLGM